MSENENNIAQLRERYEEAIAENKALKAGISERDQQLRGYMFKDAGIPVGDDPIADLVAKSYDGEMTAEAIAEYAKGFEDRFTKPPDESQADKLDAQGQTLDSLGAGSETDSKPKTGEQRIAEGDVIGGLAALMSGADQG